MRTILRYEIPVDGEPRVLRVSTFNQWPTRVEAKGDDVAEFWLEHHDQYPEADKTFVIAGTGHPIPDDAVMLGTTARTPSGLVWHLYGLPAALGAVR